MNIDDKLDLWVREVHHAGNTACSFKVNNVLFSGTSKFQEIAVLETPGHGRMLLNDGIVMLSERDEFIYHEMIAHIPLFIHPYPKHVLVIGGGDGGTVREVLKHSQVEKVVLVEIDEKVVEVCKTYLPGVACGLEDERVELHIEDGVDFVSRSTQTFDIVMVDSTDPIGPAEPLFNESFYRRVYDILNEKGILISQAESPFYDGPIQAAMLENQRRFFQVLKLYFFPTITYPGGLWSFAYASKGLCPIENVDKEKIAQADFSLQYYNADIHLAAFALPEFIKEKFSHLLT